MNPKYNPVHRPDKLIIGTGSSLILCGWTPVESVIKHLAPEDYACIGPLYSPHYGLTPLIANLLANPYQWQVLILSASRQDQVSPAGQAFYEFLEGNYYKQGDFYFVTKGKSTEVIGSFSGLFEEESLEQLIDNTAKVLVHSVDALVRITKTLTLNKPRQYAEPRYYKFPTPEAQYLPGPLYAPRVEANTITEAWLKAIYQIRTTGRRTSSQYGERQELINLVSVIYNEPSEFHYEDWCPVTPDYMEGYLPSMLSAEGVTENSYTYGSRLTSYNHLSLVKEYQADSEPINQIEIAAQKLAANPGSTQVVMCTWCVEQDLNAKSPPCLTQIWARVIDNQLVLDITFRSHDFYTAYPSNLMAIRRMQDVLIKRIFELNSETVLSAGPLICNSKSAHIYEWSYQHADEVIKQQYFKKQRQTYDDPVGNFVIERSGLKIVVTQTDEEGQPVKCYEGAAALDLVRQITKANPGIQPDHIGYLGMELGKLELSINNNIHYEQDR